VENSFMAEKRGNWTDLFNNMLQRADRKDDAAEPAADQAEETEADLSAQPDTREAALHEPLARDKDASASETAAQQDLDIVLLSNIARGAARISGSFLPGR
jgi:hypothetical protein